MRKDICYCRLCYFILLYIWEVETFLGFYFYNCGCIFRIQRLAVLPYMGLPVCWESSITI